MNCYQIRRCKMSTTIPKERVIFQNYELEEDARGYCEEYYEGNYTEEEYFEAMNRVEEEMWEIAKEELDKFFAGVKHIAFFGEIGRWNGVYRGGKIDKDFWKLFESATKDCRYIKIYDVNGHLHLTCSHHDGTCHFEIKEVTEKGWEYYDNWNYGSDDRSEEYVMTQIFERYSKLPNFAHKVYGNKVREYVKASKEAIINAVNNQARSFYC